MKKTIRFLSLVLAVLFCAIAFISCADNGKNTETTVAEAVDTDPLASRFRNVNYEGETFLVYARESTAYSHKGIYASEQSGDLINDETLKRNQAVEAKYNIKFDIKTTTDPYDTIAQDIQADLVDYDLILERRCMLANAVTSGYLYDWNSLGIDTNVSWWDSNCVNGYNLSGYLYLAVNDVSIRNLADARFLYFNKAIVENYGLSDPYALVDANNWTLDEFIKLVKSVSDPGADKTILGTYGMLREDGSSNGNHMHLATGCGISYTRYEDDNLVCNIDGNNVIKLQDIFDKLSAVFTDDYTKTYSDVDAIDKSTGYDGMFEKGRANFASGHFLFVQNGMGESDLFQDMTKGFGVVPNPKYNTDQDRYYHKVDRFSLIWAIPNHPGLNTEKIADITDYWAYQSSTTVMASYYEVVTKARNVDETTAGKNLDIIKNSISYEIGDIFDFGISENLDNGYMYNSVSKYFTSGWIKNINKKIDNVNQAIYDISG